MKTAWIVVAVAGLLITLIRTLLASNASKKQNQAREELKNSVSQELQDFLYSDNGHSDFSIFSSCTCLAVDLTKGILYGINSESAHRHFSIPLAELVHTQMDDHSEEYRHCIEMEGYYQKIHRTSMYSPYGGHSWEEVKEGHKGFEKFKGETVFGIDLTHRNGSTDKYSLFRGNGTLFWTEEQQLEEARIFVGKLDDAIKKSAPYENEINKN